MAVPYLPKGDLVAGTKRVDWKARCLEAEEALERCSSALDLVPVGPLELGQTWYPSSVAVLLLRQAKDAVNNFILRHWHGSGGPG